MRQITLSVLRRIGLARISAGIGPVSLKARLGLGAAVLGVGTCVTALILWFGMSEVAERLDAAVASERRMSRYAALSQQAATFLVVATEAVQTGLPPETRLDRIMPVADQLRGAFGRLREGVEEAVAAAEAAGLDQQSRFGTQSLGIARMEAMMEATLTGLGADDTDKPRLRAHIDAFASSFDPLLNQAVNTEVLFRNAVLAGIETLRMRLTTVALAIGGLTILAVTLFQFALVRPQFRRLDELARAARQIGGADFAVALPQTEGDEIGRLYRETNRMAAALSDRQAEVEDEWRRLNLTIAERTEALSAANARLSEVDENRRRFFADVSHELRTPLTVILMEAQIGVKETGADAFRTIEARATRLNRRIDDLLRVARSDSGQLTLEPEETRLAALVEAATAETEAEVANAGMRLHVEVEGGGALRCDPNWIRQVIVSLIRNAVRHARGGGAVKVTARTVGDRIEIAVLDNGPGVAPEDQARVFERFAQTEGGAAGQGFGIGLAMVRWVVEAHRGEVFLLSPTDRAEALGDGIGTKVGLRLPAANA